MIGAIILLLIGFGIVFIEFYLPGGIMGIIGGIIIALAIIEFASESDSILATSVFILASIVLFVLMIKYVLWKIPHTDPKYSIYSADNQQGYYASKNLPHAVGRTATALTDLRPGGYIDLDGQRVQAISKYGYIDKGSEVEIIANVEESLIVKIKR
jgi:membrane-bound ClpP family serine protease